MRTPNTTFDIYLDNRLPPASPDVEGETGHLRDAWLRGSEAGEGARTFFFTSILEVRPGVNLPDAYPGAPGSTTVWVPDRNGQAYRVVFVERERTRPGDDFLRVFLVKGVTMAITVKEADGSPSYSDVVTIIVDQADGFSLSQPAANQVRIDLTITDALLSLSDITTNDVSTSKHGFCPKAPNDTTKFLRGDGTWAVPPEGGIDASWVKVTKTYSDLSAASTTNNIEIYSLPAKGVIHGVILKHTTQFSGGAISGYNVSVGTSGGGSTRYASLTIVSGAPSDTTFTANGGMSSGSNPQPENFSSATSIRLYATATGDNLDQATQGSVDIYLLVSQLP